MQKLNKYEQALWNLLLEKGPRKEYYINGHFLTFEEAQSELKKEFNLEGLNLLHITISLMYGDIFKKVEPGGEVKIVPQNKMLKYLN